MEITIKETLERTIEVESVEEAVQKYENEEIVLNADDHSSTEFVIKL